MVAVVNGYVCFTTCDADKAKQGKDPNARPGDEFDPEKKKKDGLNGQPATILDGALKELQDAVDPAKQSDPSDPTKNRGPGDPAKLADAGNSSDPSALSDPSDLASSLSPFGDPAASSRVDVFV